MFFPDCRPEPPSRLSGMLLARLRAVLACGIGRVRSLPARRVSWLWRARTRGSLSWPGSLLPRFTGRPCPGVALPEPIRGAFRPPAPPWISLLLCRRRMGLPGLVPWQCLGSTDARACPERSRGIGGGWEVLGNAHDVGTAPWLDTHSCLWSDRGRGAGCRWAGRCRRVPFSGRVLADTPGCGVWAEERRGCAG